MSRTLNEVIVSLDKSIGRGAMVASFKDISEALTKISEWQEGHDKFELRITAGTGIATATSEDDLSDAGKEFITLRIPISSLLARVAMDALIVSEYAGLWDVLMGKSSTPAEDVEKMLSTLVSAGSRKYVENLLKESAE